MHGLHVLNDLFSLGVKELERNRLLTIFPQGLLHLHVWVYHGSFAVLDAVAPHAVVDAAVDPHVGTKPFLFIVFVLALVAAAILPEIHSFAVHLSIDPVTVVTSLGVFIGQFAFAVHQAVKELAYVHITVLECPFPRWSLFALLKVAFVPSAVQGGLDPVAILSVEKKAALVAVLEHARSVFAGHLTLTLSHALSERALDCDAQSHNLLDALAVRHSVDEAAAVFIAIRPFYLSFAVRYQLIRANGVALDLAGVEGTVGEHEFFHWVGASFGVRLARNDTCVCEALSDAIQGDVLKSLAYHFACEDASEVGLQADHRRQMLHRELYALAWRACVFTGFIIVKLQRLVSVPSYHFFYFFRTAAFSERGKSRAVFYTHGS